MRPALPLLALLLAVAGAAEAVTVAVVSTGIDDEHPELAGRVERVGFAGPDLPAIPGMPDADDLDGQGTAVASIAAGRTLGVAPDALLLDLQVRRTPSSA
ncbi:MAG TPA: S8 family serine peptidase, partial [Candidatus Thermoplasmatota archaeon]|nr:S8 family serine peptidase [Candidatus Thermoplasmatota archaeon]